MPAPLTHRFSRHEPFARGTTGCLFRIHGQPERLLKLLDREALGSEEDVAQLKAELPKQIGLRAGKLLEFGTDASQLWILREFVQGESLVTRVTRSGVLPLWEALAIAAQLARQLDELHRAGLLQRELKLGHVLLSAGPVPVVHLIDAGVWAHGAPDEHGAPELRAGGPAGVHSDLYELGRVLHAMLAGESGAETLDLPKPLAQLAAALLEHDPHARPISAQQVRQTLEPFLPRPMPDTTNQRVQAPPRSRTGASKMSDKTQEIALEDMEAAEPKDAPTQEIDPAEVEAAIAASLAQRAVAAEPQPGPVRSSALPPAAAIRQRLSTRPTSSAPPPPPPAAGTGVPAKRPISSRPAPPPEALAHRTSSSAPPPRTIPSRKATEMGMPAVKPGELARAATAPRTLPPPVARGAEPARPAAEEATRPQPSPEAQTSPGTVAAARKAAGSAVPAEPADATRARRGTVAGPAQAPSALPPLAASPQPSAAGVAEPAQGPSALPPLAASPQPSAAGPAEPEQAPSALPPLAASPGAIVVPAAQEPATLAPPVASPQPSAASVADPAPAFGLAAREATSELEEAPARAAEPASAAPPPEIAAPSALDPHTPPSLPGARSGFDVESLFEDKLEPERRLISAPADLTHPKVDLNGSNTAGSYHPPRGPLGRAWPLLAAAGVLGLTVIGFSARACNASDEHVARSTPTPSVQPAPPPPTAAPPTATPEPAAPPATAAAEATQPVQSPAPAAEGENEALAADTKADVESRTLTAAQARPLPLSSRGGVVAYHAADEPDVDYKARGRTLFSSGKYREAAEAYQRASQRTPSDAGAYAGLGASWSAAGQPDRAITAYQRAVQLKPDVSGFQAALGRAYLQKGDRGRAAAAYRKALELDPQNPAAKSGLSTLK